jgi:hypothetical protein
MYSVITSTDAKNMSGPVKNCATDVTLFVNDNKTFEIHLRTINVQTMPSADVITVYILGVLTLIVPRIFDAAIYGIAYVEASIAFSKKFLMLEITVDLAWSSDLILISLLILYQVSFGTS